MMADELEVNLSTIGENAINAISDCNTLESLERLKTFLLGKKGKFTSFLKNLGNIPAHERPKLGEITNKWKERLEKSFFERKEMLTSIFLLEKIEKEKIDTTAPARKNHQGSIHVITQTTEQIISVFNRLGFELTLGPEVETEYFNFEAVNIPAQHPARDMHDTFFLSPGIVLRTHTSGVQVRSMQSRPWPLRLLSPGAVYRCDHDSTHSPMFHHMEGLWVDQDVRMSDLKGTLQFFAKEMFGSKTQIRLRPSYFPFVEPGAEVDVSCFQCRTKLLDSCRICKGTRWLEILGAGMIHPHLFQEAGYKDYSQIKGFAFGLGIDRIAMLLYEIPDIRLLFQGDLRLLRQF